MTLIRYMRPHKGNLSVILITMLLSVGLGVLRPWPIKILLDNVLGTHPLGRGLKHLVNTLPGTHDKQALLLYIAIALVVIFALSTVIQMFNTIASISFGQRMVFDLGGDLFLHVQRLSLLFHSRRPVGDTIARVTGDPYSVQELVTGVLIPLLSNIITIATILLVMLRINVVMTLISLGIIPFFVLGVRLFREPMKARVRERRDLEGTMMSVVERSLNAIPAVQSNTREDREYGVYSERATETVRAYVRSTYAQLWFQLVVGFVSAAGISAIIYVGGHYALDGKITPGTVVLFFLYLNQLYNPLTSITYTAASYQSAAAKADRVLEILDTPLDIQDAPDAQEVKLSGDVCVEDVTFGYIPNRPVLKGISLVARPGEVVAIVGPTGAGKTTLVSMLVRFFDPWNGRVTIDGIDIRRLKVRSLRQQIAIVLQDPFIFPLTVAENIAYGRPDATRAEIVAAAQAANADEFIRRLPDGYDSVIGERGATLSGGEKQRLSIARAFLKDAPILILDEPTSALDARTEGRLLDALDRLMQGRTTLIIAHRLSTIRAADCILVMDNGEIIERGRHEELVRLNGLYALLYRQQMDLASHEGLDFEVRSAGG